MTTCGRCPRCDRPTLWRGVCNADDCAYPDPPEDDDDRDGGPLVVSL